MYPPRRPARRPAYASRSYTSDGTLTGALIDLIFDHWKVALPIIAVLLMMLGALGWHVEYGTEHRVTFTVKQLDDQSTGQGHKYLVFTTSGTVYENTDSWLHGKTDSSNVQAMFNVGGTYNCPVYGFRVFWFSSYQDILDGCRLVRVHG